MSSGPKCWYRVEWCSASEGNPATKGRERDYRGWYCSDVREHNRAEGTRWVSFICAGISINLLQHIYTHMYSPVSNPVQKETVPASFSFECSPFDE